MIRKVSIIFILSFVVLLFVYAAVSKLLDYQKFIVQIGQSPILTPFAGFLAWFVPSIELLIAGMLFFPRFRLIGMYAAFALMVIFTAYIVAVLTVSATIPCSCGGVLEKLTWSEHLVFNGVVTGLTLVGIVLLLAEEPDQSPRTTDIKFT